MVYRPQFVFPDSAADCQDVRTHFSFDYSNVPLFASDIPSSWNSNTRIPLVIDKDAPFLLRGIEVSPTSLGVGLLDPFNNPLLDNGQEIAGLGGGLPPFLPVEIWAGSAGLGVGALEGDNWGVFCPRGARFGLYLSNTTGGAVAAPVITLHGVKRYRKGDCR